jgi:hypothetical protein
MQRVQPHHDVTRRELGAGEDHHGKSRRETHRTFQEVAQTRVRNGQGVVIHTLQLKPAKFETRIYRFVGSRVETRRLSAL